MHVELLSLILLRLVVVFEFRVFLEQPLDLHLVASQDALTLVGEGPLDGSQRISVVGSRIFVLLGHTLDELVDVVVLLAACFNVLVVFILKVSHELLDDVLLILDDFATSLLLHNDIFVELFAVFFLLELLPGPVNLDVLLVRGDDLILDFLGSFSLHLLLADASLVLEPVGVRTDFGDDFARLPLHLLEQAP